MLKYAEQPSRSRDNYDWRARWNTVLSIPIPKSVVVLVVDRATLVSRVKVRKSVEPHLDREYNRDKWLRVFQLIDLDALYEAWFAELKRREIPFVEVDGTR